MKKIINILIDPLQIMILTFLDFLTLFDYNHSKKLSFFKKRWLFNHPNVNLFKAEEFKEDIEISEKSAQRSLRYFGRMRNFQNRMLAYMMILLLIAIFSIIFIRIYPQTKENTSIILSLLFITYLLNFNFYFFFFFTKHREKELKLYLIKLDRLKSSNETYLKEYLYKNISFITIDNIKSELSYSETVSLLMAVKLLLNYDIKEIANYLEKNSLKSDGGFYNSKNILSEITHFKKGDKNFETSWDNMKLKLIEYRKI